MKTRLKPTEDGTPGLKALRKRFAMMKGERDKFVPQWRRVSDLVVPYRGRFNEDEPNAPTDINRSLIDPTPTRALETLQAGMQSGLTSPSRPWFKLQVADPELASKPSVQRWCDDARDRILAIIARSNMYDCYYDLYGEVAAFGTGALVIEEHAGEVIHGIVLTAGEYCVSYDAQSSPSAFARSLWMSAEQQLSRFGEDRISRRVEDALAQNRPDAWFKVSHMIVPDKLHDTRFPFMSVYWEEEAGVEGELFVGGHDEFPVLVPRWHTVGNDTYGYGPGYLAASEAATLHELRKDHLIADKKLIDPPMVAPEAARSFGTDTGPGMVNYSPADAAYRPLYQINFDVGAHMAAIQDSRNFLNQLFFADLFLMIASMDQDSRMTATEAQIRKEEKLQMLGPVTERLTHELLDPSIRRVFMIGFRNGEFPPPPQELLDQPIKIEYISILAMAQIAGNIADMQVFMGAFGGVAQMAPEALDKINADETVDQLVHMSNVPSSIIRSDEEVAALRKQRAEQQAQAAQMAQMQAEAAAIKQGSGAIKDLANSPVSPDSVLGGMGAAMGQ